jgi:group I intron endonuclease
MLKYGPDGFEFKVLEYCNEASLDERESFWIVKLNSLYPSGYNLTSGGGAFQKHNVETKLRFSERQRSRIESGQHIFTDPVFIEKRKQAQIELVRQGLHPSQSPEVRRKRAQTVNDRKLKEGKFFTHSPDEIERKRNEQKLLYQQGLGKFQQPGFIARNLSLIKQKLGRGEHHTQRPDWTAKAIESARAQMKPVVLCIRTHDGLNVTRRYQSINDAARALDARKKGISDLCNHVDGVLTVSCNEGRIIRGAFGAKQPWTQEDVERIEEKQLTRSTSVQVTILTEAGDTVVRVFQSQRIAAKELDAERRALRFILKGEKYKSTKCSLGRIVKVVEVLIDR